MDELKSVSPIVTPATRYRHTDGSERGVERRIACEKAYRRGGLHLARMAVEALLDRLPLCPENDVMLPVLRAEMDGWLARLEVWYGSVDERGSMVLPPAFEVEEGEL